MRFWHHIVAALVGLILAAALVTVAFRQADESGSAQSGEAPAQLKADGAAAAGANPDCGRQSPAESRRPSAVKQAETALPQVFDGTGTQVDVSRSTQKSWFARVQALSGTCVDEITVGQRDLQIVMTFASSVGARARGEYLIGTLNAAFQAPLARRLVRVNWASEDSQGSILIRSGVWTQFRQSRGALGLPNTLDGLARYGKRVGLNRDELAISGG